MRTFIFIKKVRKNRRVEKHIVGMTQSDMYPSNLTCSGGQFEFCHCIEVTEKCDIKIGYND